MNWACCSPIVLHEPLLSCQGLWGAQWSSGKRTATHPSANTLTLQLNGQVDHNHITRVLWRDLQSTTPSFYDVFISSLTMSPRGFRVSGDGAGS